MVLVTELVCRLVMQTLKHLPGSLSLIPSTQSARRSPPPNSAHFKPLFKYLPIKRAHSSSKVTFSSHSIPFQTIDHSKIVELATECVVNLPLFSRKVNDSIDLEKSRS